MAAIVAILDFKSVLFAAIFILTVTAGLQMKVSNQLTFHDSVRGSRLGFPTGTIKILLSTGYPDTSYQVMSQLAIPFKRVQNLFSR